MWIADWKFSELEIGKNGRIYWMANAKPNFICVCKIYLLDLYGVFFFSLVEPKLLATSAYSAHAHSAQV